MATRLDLHAKLISILGSKNVYFQPPESVKMQYPAIRYSLSDLENDYANNFVYNQYDRYSVTYIDKNPDNTIVKNISRLPLCQFIRHYTSDNLNHYLFELYF